MEVLLRSLLSAALCAHHHGLLIVVQQRLMQKDAAAGCPPLLSQFHHLTLSGMTHFPPRALAALLQQGSGSAVSLTKGLTPPSPTSAPAIPRALLHISARFSRATITNTTDMLDAPALRIQRCTTKLSWVSYFIGVALIFSLSMLLLCLTDCVLSGVTQSQLPLHLLWLGIELWLSGGGNSGCFPLLCRLRLGFRRLAPGFFLCRATLACFTEASSRFSRV